MKAFVGLGNPGKKYTLTRHNLGSRVILKLSSNLTLKPKLSAHTYKTADCIYAIPATFMNHSGLAVAKIIKFYQIKLDHLYIIHDDLDLRVGDYKIQFGRGSAGHKGIESIINHLHSQNFWRIRIGIGRPPVNISAENFVLQPFTFTQKRQINAVIDKITKQILCLAGEV